MTILVTGGAGFIGANFIIDWLQTRDEGVVNLDKLTYAGNLRNLASVEGHESYTFIRGDIGDSVLVPDLLVEHKPRAVINFAAESHVDRSIHCADDFIGTNVVGVYRLLDNVLRYWSELPEAEQAGFRFLHVSTDEVYGALEPGAPAFTEDNSYKPNNPYSASKAASDHLVRAFHHTYGLPALTSNCSNNYGPFQFPEKLVPLFIHNALAQKPLPLYGDGRQVRDWLYVRDHCAALRQVLETGEVGEVYNIGGNNEKTNLEIATMLCEILDEIRPGNGGESYKSLVSFVKDRPGHDRRYAMDSSKIRRELGWKASETVESGIRKTVLWYLENQDWVAATVGGGYRDWIRKQYR
ncbi:MAG: dTDP-glucose 4,6-dehydratase [Gammaproteobacteria bacterium]|nr:dTDP-glucose 4,6-dehydratase [Gammaproteobacteria bacterium]MDE0285961.1 dTDP-glucose 4,6-dehydratase [Gammaproteobacteria bacterium]MDE0511822.1 dTDP-glucose 4,6-dehydratase [Gammaproteobacteria bacterium]